MDDFMQSCYSLILPNFVGISWHQSAIRWIWPSPLITSDITMTTNLMAKLFILAIVAANSSTPERVCIILCSPKMSRASTDLPLIFEYLLHFALWNRRRRSLDLSIDVFHLSNTALAKVARWSAPRLVLEKLLESLISYL